MKFVFLMDPLSTVIIEKDTSFILMAGSQRRGHEVYFLPAEGLTLLDGQIIFHATRVTAQPVKEKPFVEGEAVRLPAAEVDAVFIRTDPPFDEEYLRHTWLLDRLPPHVAVLNSPSGIRTVNEKLWATQFTNIVPRTLVSRNPGELLKFLREEKDVVAKPTDGHGGRGVFRIRLGDSNTHVIFETLTRQFKNEIILQPYIPESAQGDKRILLLHGEPLGAVLRVHAQDDHRNNIFSGGKAEPAKITEQDRAIMAVLKPHLIRLGLSFVGIDILGKYLIEVNVTSPTCLQEMNRFYHQTLEDDVIAFAENLVAQRRSEATIK